MPLVSPRILQERERVMGYYADCWLAHDEVLECGSEGSTTGFDSSDVKVRLVESR